MQGTMYRVWGLGVEFVVSGSGLRAQGSGYRV